MVDTRTGAQKPTGLDASLRDRILAATQEIVLREGISGLSMRKVATEVGVSAAAIYRHFDSKEALLSEVVVAGLRVLEGYLRPGLAAATPFERLQQLTRSYLAFAMEQPQYFDLAFLTPAPNIASVSDEIARPMWDTFRGAIDQVVGCMARGDFERDDPLSTAIMIWAEVHGLVTLFRTGRMGPDPEQFRFLYEASVERMFRGLRPRSAPGQPGTDATTSA